MGRTRRTFTAEEKLKVVMAVIQEERLADRREKLYTADIKRKAYWLEQQA